MQPLLTYDDAYLATFCIREREDRAVAEVARLAAGAGVTLSTEWAEQLAVVQCYVLAALENQASPDDLFAAKLKAYRARFEAMLPQAIAAAQKAAGVVTSASFFSIPLERA